MTYRQRLKTKDGIIYRIMASVPVLIGAYDRDGCGYLIDPDFAFHIRTRPEYDGDHLKVEMVCVGNRAKFYQDRLYKFFEEIDSLGLDMHITNLTAPRYNMMVESFLGLMEDEIGYGTPELSGELRNTGRREDNLAPVC